MKNIAMISEHASPLVDLGSVDSGGQNVYVAHVAGNLARLGYQVDIFTRRYEKTLPEVLNWKENVRVIHVPAGPAEFVRKEHLLGYMGTFTEYMIDFIEQEEKPYDLIHANFWMSGLVAAQLKAALGIPFVITFHALGRVRRLHQGNNDEFPDERFQIEHHLVREADGIVAECPQDKYDLVYFYNANPEKIAQIPCGFDPNELWPVDKVQARKHIGIPVDERIILQLGRMVPRKGVDTVVRGFARLVNKNSIEARLVVVGGESNNPDPALTPEIGRLQQIAAEEGVSDRVLFIGRRGREELKYYFSAADIFVSTPWYEPFGITPIESMACGTPVIGANVGGIKFTVMDGETGYLIPPNDPDALARQLTELYQHPDKLQHFSAQSIQRVNELFTWKQVGSLMAGFYEQVLQEKHSVVARRNGNGNHKHGSRYKNTPTALIEQSFAAAMQTIQHTQVALDESILGAAKLIIDCLERSGKIMVCGNGGSAADAQHFTAELVGRFIAEDRKGLPVLALTADSAFLTAWSNDVGYEKVFMRQVEALGRSGDLLMGISTSGRSRNLVEAFKFAKEMDIECLGVLGSDGGELLPLSDVALVIPSANTQRIQETQMLILHLLCELVEEHFKNDRLVASGLSVDALVREKSPAGKGNGKVNSYTR